MSLFSLQWAAEQMNARMIGGAEGDVLRVCTDTRQEVAGSLFFALQGESADAHDYVPQAFEKGAVGAVVSRQVEGISGPQLLVPDTLRALGDLAKHYRRQFDIPVIGVTGSIGKTSTREMIAAVLQGKYHVLASERNLNTEVGVPLTLFRLTNAHTAAIIEMGMRGLGEIDYLAAIAEPTIGVITNIGYAHIERLGSQQGIAQAKSELLTHLPKDGIAILPETDPFLPYLKSRVPEGVAVVTFGIDADDSTHATVRLRPIASHADSGPSAIVRIGQREAFFALKARGAHHLSNAGAALAVASVLGVPLKEAAAALEAWEGAPGRMTVVQTPNGMTVLDDCYNAAPESMASALATLAQATVAHGVAVLGEMRELGDYAPEAHRFVGRKVIEAQPRLLITVGELAQEIAAEAGRHAQATGQRMPEHRHFAGTLDAVTALPALLTPKDTVLIKGSRALKMERIVAALTGKQDTDAHG